LIHIWTNQ